MSKNPSALSCLVLIALVVISVIVPSLLDGWALSIMWGWFIVHTFLPFLPLPWRYCQTP